MVDVEEFPHPRLYAQQFADTFLIFKVLGHPRRRALFTLPTSLSASGKAEMDLNHLLQDWKSCALTVELSLYARPVGCLGAEAGSRTQQELTVTRIGCSYLRETSAILGTCEWES